MTPDCTYWDTVPAAFLEDDRSNPARAAAAGIVRREVAAGAQTVTEIGPGTGIDFELLRPIPGLEYMGIDGSRGMVQRLVDKHGPYFIQGGFDDIPPSDIVYCRSVLEHQPDFRRPLQAMLEAASRLVLVSWYRPPAKTTEADYDVLAHVHYNTFAAADVATAIEQAGWTVTDHWTTAPDNLLQEIRPA
ncbi:MAG: class I SAM-dependent methyltransferase [bacterium]|nr:class I SAM-dependent methyltransferase [bacterium]